MCVLLHSPGHNITPLNKGDRHAFVQGRHAHEDSIYTFMLPLKAGIMLTMFTMLACIGTLPKLKCALLILGNKEKKKILI